MEVVKMSKTKQVIVMRNDLNMRKGKMIAQGAHASMSFLLKEDAAYNAAQDDIAEWLESSFAKVCVYVNSEEELINIYEQAKEKGLIVHMITDLGRTEFKGIPTKTCLAIGPNKSEKIDEITGNLKLL
jgi:PTH2 family peptidyl-tRNA hydrolase